MRGQQPLDLLLFAHSEHHGMHRQIFWLGDLNYRLADLEHDRVKTMVEQGLLEKLLEHDQVRKHHYLFVEISMCVKCC